MKSYGQFCSIAKALEVVGERWTPLILREMICGSSRFNEIHRGVPRISPSLLTKRLSDLEFAGVIKKKPETGGYELTSAGWELRPVIEALGIWGQRWVRGQLSDDKLDPDVLMWDMRRRFDNSAVPKVRTCLCFVFTDAPEGESEYWLVLDNGQIELCITDPHFTVDLFITSDVRTMVEVWSGDTPISTAIDVGKIDLHGPQALQKAFPSWLQLSLFAGVEPAEADL